MGTSRADLRGSSLPRVLRGAILVVLLPISACATLDPAAVATGHVRAMVEEHGTIHRWPPGTTLVVDATALDDRDAALVMAAFGAWLEESPVPVAVRRAGAGDSPNVWVRSAARVASREPASGRARLDRRGVWIERAMVEIGERDSHGVRLSSLDRWKALVHEAGHVLGLGHSPRVGSVMHETPSGASVDAGDRAALTLLYATTVTPAAPPVASTRDTP